YRTASPCFPTRRSSDLDDIRLAAFTGKPVLVVNTASLCGYTPQYAGLQELWSEFRARGLTVIGVPSNDFGGQEPGGTSEISETRSEEHTSELQSPYHLV